MSLAPNGTIIYRLSKIGPIILVAILVLLASSAAAVAQAATPPLDKNSLHALSGHIFVGSIAQIQSKPYTDPTNDEWKETHFLLTVKVTAVLKTAKHTNSLSGDFDFTGKMSKSFEESVKIGSVVSVITSTTVSLPTGWSGDIGLNANFILGETHTFYCTHLGKRRFQFDTTFPFAANVEKTQTDKNNKKIIYDSTTKPVHSPASAYLALSPNGIGPVISHEEIVHDAMVTPAELFEVLDKSALLGSDSERDNVSTLVNETNETNHNTSTYTDNDGNDEGKISQGNRSEDDLSEL